MKKYILLFPALLLLMTGCLKDNTVTEFGDVELPVLDNPDEKPELLTSKRPYSLKYGDVLEINANITYSDPDALTYRWVINGKDIPEDKENGTYRNHLKWTCDLEDNAAAALYVMIPAQKAGKPIATIFNFYIELDHPYEQGVMIAMDQEGKVVYNFLQERPGKPFVEHTEAYVSNTPADSWLGMIEFWSNESRSVIGNRFHMDKNPLNCHTIEPGLVMSSQVALEQEFMALPAGLEVADARFGGYVGYIIGSDHKVYARKSQKGYYTGRYSTEPLKYDGQVLHISKFAESPYRTGTEIAYDMDNERFLSFDNAFNANSNKKAGTIYEIPEGVKMNDFQGEEIIYMRAISPDFPWDPFSLFILSRNKKTNIYSGSEYGLEMSDGQIIKADRKYFKEPLENFGENSVFVVLDSPSYGMGYIYYTDNNDAKILRYGRRESSGIGNFGVFDEFPAEVVSLSQSKIGRRSKWMVAGFNDRSVKLFDLTVSMSEYTEAVGEEKGSLLHEWKDLKGDVLSVKYCYGNISAY